MFITGTELTAFAAVLRTQGHGPATVVKYHREAAAFAAWLGEKALTAERDLARLADILGHASVDTIRIYTLETGLTWRRKLDKLNLLL